MKTIVAPTDFSPTSLNAVNYAADMAQAIGAGLSLLHVCAIPQSPGKMVLPPESMTDMKKEAEEALERLKINLHNRTCGDILITTKVRSGTVATQITEYCESCKPFVVVIGTQGSNAYDRLFFGDNTIGVMKHLIPPLLIVPPLAQYRASKTSVLS